MTKRPLLFGVMAFVIGELTGLNTYMAMGLGMAVVLLLLFMVWNKRRKQQTMPFLMLFLGISFLLGILNGWRCQLPEPFLDYLEEIEADSISCQMTGEVRRIEYKDQKRILLVQTEQIDQEAFRVVNPYVIKLYEDIGEEWEGADRSQNGEAGDSQCEYSEIMIGNRITCELELQVLKEPTNPGEFNAKQYYQARGIDFLGFAEEVTVLEYSYSPVRQWLTELQSKAQQVFTQCLSEENAGLMSAMLLGSSGELDSQMKKLYQRNGIAHILAISALHLSIIGNTLYKILRKAGASYWGAGIPVILLLILYGWLTGFSGSTIRAVIMFALALTGDMLGRTYDMLTAIGVSCLCILVGNPYRLWDAGFLLSFGAVLTLGVVVPELKGYLERFKKGKLRWYLANSLLSGVVLQVMTAPIVIYFYYDYPVYGVVLNLIVVPLMTPVVICGFAGLLVYPFLPWLGYWILAPCEWILNLFTSLCQGAEQLPGAIWHVGAIRIWEILVYYGVFLAGYGLIKHKKRIQGIAIVLIYGLWLLMSEDAGLRVIMLDVGQGDCFLVETPGEQHILMDGGSSSRSKIGEYIITPAVKYYGSGCLDYVFVSHMDTDHVNGIEELIELSRNGGIQIRYLVVPGLAAYDAEFQVLIEQAETAGIQICTLDCGDQLLIDDVVFTCVYPDTSVQSASSNDTSMVVSMTYREFDMLFMGDLEMTGEARMLEVSRGQMSDSYDVLKVGHHGSSGSSSMEFLEQIQPWFAWISCGKNNRYGHPHEETMERLEQVTDYIDCTMDTGAVELWTDGVRMEINNAKEGGI